MGNGEWEEITNAPSGGAAVPLHPQGVGVSRRFQ